MIKELRKASELLNRGQWKESRAAFERALKVQESAEALEGLGTSCSWLNDGDAAIEARENAFRLYKESDDDRSAVRVAVWLANDWAEFRGESAVADGWLQHARRLGEKLEPCEEQGLVLTVSAVIKLLEEKNPKGARKLALKAQSIAETVRSKDVLMAARAVEGFTYVSEGEVRKGIRLMDEAAITAINGECKNLNLIGAACCLLISACEKARDFDRAGQWCEQVLSFCRRWKIGSFFSVCRTQYTSVLISRGEWSEAEEELTIASEELNERRRGLISGAVIRLAELRRRQGRFEESESLYQNFRTHPLSLLGQAAIAFDREQPETAVEYAQRYLRRIPRADRIERLPGLEMLIRAYAAGGEIEKAKRVFSDLRKIITPIGTEPLQGALRYAEGTIAASENKSKRALACFEDAVDLFEKSAMPYESVAARIELAKVLLEIGRKERAEAEAKSARVQAEKINSRFLTKRAENLLGSRYERWPAAFQQKQIDDLLSRREEEIVLLIAEGKDNSRIANELFLSVRTVERHISNVYRKLGISGKSARVAAAAYAFKNVTPGSR